MRSVIRGVIVSGLLAGCSGGGGSETSGEGSGEPPPAGTPQDNAQPPTSPIDGTPIPGVYVSTSLGNDDGAGTLERPLKTLAKAFARANEQHVRVIACAETYEESLVLIDGVSAYGYYECAVSPWKKGERRAIVKGTSSPTVLAKGLRQATRLEGFEILGPDLDKTPATEEAGSSIALEVRDSQQISISESLIRGGDAAHGIAGEAGTPNTPLTATVGENGARQGGTPTRCSVQNVCAVLPEYREVPGGRGATATCASGDAPGQGGQGGAGRFWIGDTPNSVAPEHRGSPLVATATTAAGGLGGANPGVTGSDGPPGDDGIDGVNGAWTLAAGGFAPGRGTVGTVGTAGRGGGGGGGTYNYLSYLGGSTPNPSSNVYTWTASGGGGGAGGCGGVPGTAGTGGGASIGALVIGSAVVFEKKTRIESATGGTAGLGLLGQIGTNGPLPGHGTFWNNLSDNTRFSGSGGYGGPGGNGGASGHGAAGPSIALAYAGTRPLLEGVELVAGPGGAGQPALKGNGPHGYKNLPAAPVGASEREHEIKP